MSEQEIDQLSQQIFFEHIETGETITRLDEATGVSLPSEGDEITLADVEFEETDNLATTLTDEHEIYIVRDIEWQFARATHTVADPPKVYQISVTTVYVEEAD